MSEDDVNQLTPDDGDLDEVVVARLRSALLDDVVKEFTALHTLHDNVHVRLGFENVGHLDHHFALGLSAGYVSHGIGDLVKGKQPIN